MSSLANPRGPLPPRVYWVRRGVALAVVILALLLVFGLVKLAFGGSEEQPSSTSTAQQAAAETSPEAKQKAATGEAKQKADPAEATSPAIVEPTETAPPEPNGRCTPADVEISPEVINARAYIPVTVTLNVKSRKAAACVWRYGPRTVSVKVMRDKTAIWSSSACRNWIQPKDVVLRSETVTPLTLTWNGRRSDSGCQEQYSDFAGVGTYQVVAAALGGDASAVEFGLRRPSQTTTPSTTPSATSTPSGTPSGTATRRAKPGNRASTPTRQRVNPSDAPSGAVEP